MGSAPLNTRWSSIRLRRALLVRGSAVRRRPSRGVRCRGLRSRGAWARAPQPPQPPPVGAWAAARGRTAPGTGRPLRGRRARPRWRRESPRAAALVEGCVVVRHRGRPGLGHLRAPSAVLAAPDSGPAAASRHPDRPSRPESGARGRRKRAEFRPKPLRGEFRGFSRFSPRLRCRRWGGGGRHDQPPTSRTNPSTPSTPTTAATPPISTRGGRMRLNQPARGAASAPPMIRPRTTRP